MTNKDIVREARKWGVLTGSMAFGLENASDVDYILPPYFPYSVQEILDIDGKNRVPSSDNESGTDTAKTTPVYVTWGDREYNLIITRTVDTFNAWVGATKLMILCAEGDKDFKWKIKDKGYRIEAFKFFRYFSGDTSIHVEI